MVDWAELPQDILSVIASKLLLSKDYIKFSSVCRPWQSINPPRPLHQLPYLMLSKDLNVNTKDQTRNLYSFIDKKFLSFQAPVPLNKFCRGSSFGWLVTVYPRRYRVRLENPFLTVNNKIILPTIKKFEQDKSDNIDRRDPYFITKVVLSANPTSNPNYVVMAMYDFDHLAFYKPGDKVWTTLNPRTICFQDAIPYKNQFCAVTELGALFAFDLNHIQSNHYKIIAPELEDSPSVLRRYLVQVSEDLLQIERITKFINDDGSSFDYLNGGFNVFKLDPVECKWVEVNNLHGYALFLGDNSSFSLLSSDFPGCMPNSIYFTDDYFEAYANAEYGVGPRDMGVYNIADRTTEEYYPLKSSMINPPPNWVTPIWVEPMIH